jgi:hypothetical protein
MNRLISILAPLAATGVLLAGCGGDNWFENADVTLVDAPAAYDAVVFEVVDEAGVLHDLIAKGGRFALVLDDDAREFDATFELAGRLVRTDGTFTVAGGEITFSDDPFSDDDLTIGRSLAIVRADEVILLDDPEAVFDVDGDGVTEVVDLRLRLERR